MPVDRPLTLLDAHPARALGGSNMRDSATPGPKLPEDGGLSLEGRFGIGDRFPISESLPHERGTHETSSMRR